MAGDITETGGLDLSAIEGGSWVVLADTLAYLFALVNQEAVHRDQALRTKAPEIRQDRVAMMGVYAA